MADKATTGHEEIAQRFADLRHALTWNGADRRADDEYRLLLDSVRDALDRCDPVLTARVPDFVANTFSLEGILHDGPLMQVHKARHRDMGSLHVFKTLNIAHTGDPVARSQLLREAEIGLAMQDEAIRATQVLLRLPDSRPAIVFEWCESSLAERLTAATLSLADLRCVITGVLRGLAVIHARSYVHCDVSPSNLLLADTSFQSLRIADFGAAVRTHQRQGTLDIRFAGRPYFAAPEQLDGGVLDGRTDLYAAGRLLTLLLEACREPAPRCLRMLADHLSKQKPQDRPETAEAALAMLGGR